MAGQMQGGEAEKQLRRTEGIIHSMTPRERSRPQILRASRKRRIAAGAGVQVQEVNRMLKQFEQMQGMMKKMKGGGIDRKSTRLNSSHVAISYAVFCLKKKKEGHRGDD